MHCAEFGILNLVNVSCFIGEWLVYMEGMAVRGVFGPGQLRV